MYTAIRGEGVDQPGGAMCIFFLFGGESSAEKFHFSFNLIYCI